MGGRDELAHRPIPHRFAELDPVAVELGQQIALLEASARPRTDGERDGAALVSEQADERYQFDEPGWIVDVRRPVRGEDRPGAPFGRDPGDPQSGEHIDHRVADDAHPRRIHSPVGAEPRGEIGGREVQRGARRGDQPVHFFHRRRVERPQSRLQVRDGNPVTSGRETEQRHGVRVPEEEDEVGPVARQFALRSFQDRRDAGGRIRRQRPRFIRMDVELVEERGAHPEIAVRTGRDHPDRRTRRREFPDDRCEFDYLGPRSQGTRTRVNPRRLRRSSASSSRRAGSEAAPGRSLVRITRSHTGRRDRPPPRSTARGPRRTSGSPP